ncbi:MAG: hypothetical protein GY711_30225 [bacterium]|nr:hypothetical protein [bacterium]
MRHPLSPVLPILLSLASTATAQDPFSAGERWHHQAPAASPWVPRTVGFAARDELVWGATGGVSLLDSRGTGVHAPRFHDALPTALHIETAAGSRTDALYAIAQYSAPTQYQKRTEVTRHDPLAAARGGGFVPSWVHDMGLLTAGPSRVRTDRAGETVAACVWDAATSEVQIDWLDGTSGALLSRVRLAGAALNGVDFAAGGRRLVVSAGLDLYVVDSITGVFHHEVLPSATHTVSISDDGRWLAVGSIEQLTLRRATPSGYGIVSTFPSAPGWIATCTDVSENARTLAIGWWDYVGGVNARFEVWDGRTETLLFSRSIPGASLQNLPGSARVTRDGERIAFGTWGNGSDPEVDLYARDGTVIAAVDVPGSVQSLDIDAYGTRIVVAFKDVHNNQFGSTGGIRLFDTGERSIQVIAPAQVGGAIEFATRMEGASVGFLLIGDRLPRAIRVGGVTGGLWLDRHTLAVYAAGADGNGRTDFSIPLGSDPGLIGMQVSGQAAFRLVGGTQLERFVVDPLVLE